MVEHYKFRKLGLLQDETNEVLEFFANNFYGFPEKGIRTLDALAQARKKFPTFYQDAWNEQLDEHWLLLEPKKKHGWKRSPPPIWSVGSKALRTGMAAGPIPGAPQGAVVPDSIRSAAPVTTSTALVPYTPPAPVKFRSRQEQELDAAFRGAVAKMKEKQSQTAA
jgi:hypothetical protein